MTAREFVCACDWPGCQGQCHTGDSCPCHPLRRCFICKEPTGEEEGAAIHLVVGPVGDLQGICVYCFEREYVEERLDNTERDDDAD